MNPFYWDMNEATRAWSWRVKQRSHNNAMPNDMQAGVYAATLHYLKAVQKIGGPEDGKAVVAAMKAASTDDPLFGKGRIRDHGRKLHDVYIFQVKALAESKGEWDFFKVVGSIRADQAFRPLSKGKCTFVAGN